MSKSKRTHCNIFQAAQFKIERTCPQATPADVPLDQHWPDLPLIVWVLLTPPPPPLPCGKQLYRVDMTQHATDSRGNFYVISPYIAPTGEIFNPVVCSCMGALVTQ